MEGTTSFNQHRFLVRPKGQESSESSTVVNLSPFMLLVPLNYLPEIEQNKADPTEIMAECLLAFIQEMGNEFDFHTLHYD